MQNKIEKSPLKQKNHLGSCISFIFFVIIICLLISIITFDPNDPSSFQRSSKDFANISNMFGVFGASVSDWMLQLFGSGAIVFLILFLIQLIRTFLHPISKTQVYLKSFGYSQLILFYLGLTSGIKPYITIKGIQIYTGGFIGSKIFEWCDALLGITGALIILFLGTLASLTLCIGIKPFSSALWLLRFAPNKHTKKFLNDMSEDLPPILETVDTDHPDVITESKTVILNRINQHVFTELTSVIQSKEALVFKQILQSNEFQNQKYTLPIIYGQTETNQPILFDLGVLHHILIQTDEENLKTQVVNTILLSLILNKTPSDLQLVLLDPHMLEFEHYNKIGHLLFPIVTSSHKCIEAFEQLIEEMEKRLSLLKRFKVRNFAALQHHFALPHIVVLINELYDLIVSVPYELDVQLQKLQYKSLQVGIYFIFATQKPLSIITNTIQMNSYSKLIFDSNNLKVFTDEQENSFHAYPICINSNEINLLTGKVSDLYPFCNKNNKMK